MSVYFSRYDLNTYKVTPFFEAFVPVSYPLSAVLLRCRAFRRLPPNLRELSHRAKLWAARVWGSADIGGISRWYDSEGYELDPDSGARLTDEQIDAQWSEPKGIDDPLDIPTVRGDPYTWEEPAAAVSLVDREGFTERELLQEIAERGREAVAAVYGASGTYSSDVELAQAVLGMHGKPWPTVLNENECHDGRGKFCGLAVGKKEHVHAEGVEKRVAEILGGEHSSVVGNKHLPRDVVLPGHSVEVKTILKGEENAIKVHDDALLRKVKHAEATGDVFHTVAFDEREAFGEKPERFSGHRMYYKRGSGRYSLSSMYRVGSEEELRALVAMKDEELPEKARGSLPTGKAAEELAAKAERAHASRRAKDSRRRAKNVDNSFCPTGSGGGVDPSCGKLEGSTKKAVESYVEGDAYALNKAIRDGDSLDSEQTDMVEALESSMTTVGARTLYRGLDHGDGAKLLGAIGFDPIEYAHAETASTKVLTARSMAKHMGLSPEQVGSYIRSEGLTGDEPERFAKVATKAVGKEVEDPAFVSTSSTYAGAVRYRREYSADDAGVDTGVVVRIHTPKDQRGVDVDRALGRDVEQDVITDKEVILPRKTKLRVVSVNRGKDVGWEVVCEVGR